MLKSCSGQPHPLLSRWCLQGGDVTNSAASTGFALMHDPCAVWPGPRPTAMLWSSWRPAPLTYSPCIYGAWRVYIQVRHNYTHKAKQQQLPFHFFQLNPLPLEAEHLNCGKAVIFKLDILVISEGSNNVVKLTSIRTLSPSCFAKVSLLWLQIWCCWAAHDRPLLLRWETAQFMQHLGWRS